MQSAIERFWKYVEVTDHCWNWTGYKMKNGYAQMSLGRRGDGLVLVHRFSYEHFRGPIPAGLVLDHLCRNRACVNPLHLEAVSNRTNLLRGNTTVGINARKTHCKRGHPLSGDNVRHYRGQRVCRKCAEFHTAMRRKAEEYLCSM